MLTSFVYVNLIFALASTFKHMGKALAVLLVILQIPGSSGTYPIEMMPEFFQKLHPLLPFSYSISAMRECIAGYYHHTYRSSLGKLLVFLLVALFIGLVLRPLLMNLNHLFDVRLAETDLMICETDSKGRDNPQLQRIMQVIMKDDAWRKKLTEKTLAFEKYYPVMVRSGFICMMVIPLVFLILMFSLESKLVYLILWIVSLLALMKNILKIFIGDVKRIRKNVIAMIVVIGVLVVPCLYAWFNIAASWDPYNNTGNLKVAVASVDEGYTGSLIPIEMNVGEQVISALRENTQMDWVFTSKEKAMEGVKSGQYYAAIVVPKKFSTQMMSLFSDQIQKPEIIYYSNAKENAIAPKVTDKGATAIQKQVNQVFIQTISDTAMTVFQSVSNMAEANGADRLVDNLIHNLEDASDDMDMTASTLETFSGITSSAQSLLNTSSNFLKELKTESADGKQVLENSKKTFADMKTTISSATESVGKALKAGQNVYSEMNLLLDQTVEYGINGSEDTVDTLVKAAKTVDKNIKSFTTLREHLIKLSEKHPETDSSIGPMIEKINSSIEKQEELRDDLTDTAASVKKSTTGLISDKKALDALVKENQKRLQQISNEYENDVKGTLQKLADSVKDTSADLTGLTKQINASAKGVYTLTDTAGSDLSEIQTCLDDSGKLLRKSANKLKKITDKLTKAKDNGDYADLEHMIYDNKSGVSAFLSAPVELNTKKIYPIDNYGSSMAPFYSTLSIWIGGIVLVAMLKVTVSEESIKKMGLKKVRIHEIYLGRWIIFLILGLLQSTLIALGDLYYLGIQCAHTFLFLFGCWFSSIVYVTISYTLTVSFGDIGKAGSVVLLVMQVAGTGGTFPIECAPKFFRAVYPLLPFTHSMAALRESVGGCYGNDYWIDLAKLGIFLVIALFVGLVLRKPIIRMNEAFTEQLEETKII